MPTDKVESVPGDLSQLERKIYVLGLAYRNSNTYTDIMDDWVTFCNQQSTTRQSLDTLCADAFKKTAWRYYLTRKDEYNTYPSATGHMFPWYHQNRKY